jgi:hypothetical protein
LPSRAGVSVVYSTNLALRLRRRGHDVEFHAARTSAEEGEALKERQVAVHTRPAFGVALSVNPVANVLPDVFKNTWERCREAKSPPYHENLG